MKTIKVGVRYCVLHDGIANEDDYSCDFSHDDHDGRDGEPRVCDFRELYRKVRAA